MALEERAGRPYYYRSVRDGERVRKEYVASGDLARIISERDTMGRAEEEARRERERAELERLESLAAPVVELSDVCEVLARAHLIARGFHRHKGEWRRARTA